MSLEQQATDAVVGKVSAVATGATYGGSGVAIYGGFTANEIGIFGGLLIAFLGYVTNTVITFYFKQQHLKLAKEKASAWSPLGDE